MFFVRLSLSASVMCKYNLRNRQRKAVDSTDDLQLTSRIYKKYIYILVRIYLNRNSTKTGRP